MGKCSQRKKSGKYLLCCCVVTMRRLILGKKHITTFGHAHTARLGPERAKSFIPKANQLTRGILFNPYINKQFATEH